MPRLLHILLFLLLSITAFAQRAPITVTTILTPPYTTSLSTMAESGSTRLMVNMLVNDVTITEIPVKLHIKMESSGITIESIPTQAVRPMFLGGGEARVLTGDDFAQYLNLNNLNFKGFSKDAYLKNGHLPSGLWKFSVSVRHFYTNKTISNVGTVTAWITSYKPPVLTTPKDGEIAPSNAALPLTFSWQASKHTGGTAAIMYRFEMWERRIEGVPAQAVAASVPPIYTTETAGLTATVLPATLALEPGMKYCWRVTAFDPSGMVTIENKGESEVRTFQYLEKCPEVCGLTVDIKDDTGYASWEENRMHLGGYNFEFYDDEGTCHKTLWGSSTKTAGIGGEYGKTWHVRVQGLCRSGVEGPWSDWVDFKIPDAFKPLKDENGNTYECGREIPERIITNFELIDNIQKGDTLEDERGTTKYIVHSAIKNEDGSFRGLSYMKLSIWGVKVLGEYNNMKVNTDGVIIGRYAWRSVKSDLLVADPEAIEKWADELALEMAGATYNNTIKDTILLKYSRGIVPFETIAREGTKYYAVTSDGHKEEITSFINGRKRVMVKDGDGHELVIDKDGNVMGEEEYTKCGGSSKLLSEHNAYRDSTMATSGNVKFNKVKDENYGFDEWRGAEYDKDVYDNFNGYRPTYIGAQKQSSIKVVASQTKGISFITERGVPIIAKNDTLQLTIGTTGKQSVYAYRDSTLVGKLCIQAYDVKEVKVHVVRVNNGKQLELNKIADEVNRIYSSAIVHYTFDELDPITIEYANKQHFVHGGKGTFQNYNADQKTAIKALPKTADPNDYYLFFTDCYNRLDTAGNMSKEAVNGYMPVGRHYGFIYNEYNNARTIAHELGHGTNSLHHTFSQESESFYTTEKTDNLMDYNAGEYLNHKQWQWAHEKHRNVLGFLDDEEESENISLTGAFYAILNGNENYKLYDKSTITVLEGVNAYFTIKADSFMVKYAKGCLDKSQIEYDSLVCVANTKWHIETIDGEKIDDVILSCGKYLYEASIDSFEVRLYRAGNIIKRKKPIKLPVPPELGKDITITINVTKAPIVRIEPADRENFYLEFGYDDALVEENQKNGDYTKMMIGGNDYYVPWLNINQKCEANMRLDVDNSNVKSSSYFVINGNTSLSETNNIKINGSDSLIVTSSNINETFTIACKQSTNCFIYVICCDSITKQRNIVGCLEICCRNIKNVGTISVIPTKRKGKNTYPNVIPNDIVDIINRYYVQASIEFNIDVEKNCHKEVVLEDSAPFDVEYVYKDDDNKVDNNTFRIYIVDRLDKKIEHISGASKHGGKCSFVFQGEDDVVYAHEIGHAIGLYHAFMDQNNKDGRINHIQKHSTTNIMDYSTNVHDPRKLLYKYQILQIWKALDSTKK